VLRPLGYRRRTCAPSPMCDAELDAVILMPDCCRQLLMSDKRLRLQMVDASSGSSFCGPTKRSASRTVSCLALHGMFLQASPFEIVSCLIFATADEGKLCHRSSGLESYHRAQRREERLPIAAVWCHFQRRQQQRRQQRHQRRRRWWRRRRRRRRHRRRCSCSAKLPSSVEAGPARPDGR
jgi:hypothetical protein